MALRESLAIPPRACAEIFRALRAGGLIREAVILSTCNRLEWYLATDDPVRAWPHIIDLLSHSSQLDPSVFRPNLYRWTDRDAASHLFRVAAGLESMIPGESEITAQVKQAYLLAHALGATGPLLNRLFQKSLHSAKIVRARTGINHGQASIGSVVVALAKAHLGERLGACGVLLWGAGKAAEVTARHLTAAGVRQLWIVNRTPSKAEDLASLCRGEWLSWEQALAHLTHVDIAIICTQAPHYVISVDDLDELLPRRRQQPLFVVDLAVPRNVDPALAGVSGIQLYNIDDLEAMAQETLAQRRQALDDGAAIIEQQVEQFWQRQHAASHPQEAVPC